MNALALLALAVGAGLALYPAVSNALARQRQTAAIVAYEAAIEEASGADLSALWEEARAYNDALAGILVEDPFEQDSGYAIPATYEDILNVNGDGIMASVEIPRIDTFLPIYHGTSEEVLALGAGHVEATSLPVGGAGTHAVIAAHRGLPSAELFSKLGQLEVGDVFYIHVLGETLAYQVDRISVVDPDDLSEIAIDGAEDYVTLVTCTPYGVNTQRLLVRGARMASGGTAGAEETTIGSTAAPPLVPVACLLGALIAIATARLLWTGHLEVSPATSSPSQPSPSPLCETGQATWWIERAPPQR